MPRTPSTSYRTRTQVYEMLSPLLAFARCESPAYVRTALAEAENKGQLPSAETLALAGSGGRSRDGMSVIGTRRENSARRAAAHVQNARVYFEQARVTSEATRPVLYYYGALSFLEFIAGCLVWRETRGPAGHGLSVSCDSEGWDFDRDWARKKCRVTMGSSGDFPFIVDALTAAGFPSLLSSFRVHSGQPPDRRENPAPLLAGKCTLDFICNLQLDRYLREHPELESWFRGTDSTMVLRLTALLLDFVVVYVASSLARYYIPAWQGIVDAKASPIYNDIKAAYRAVSEDLPYYFTDEHPFDESFDALIPSGSFASGGHRWPGGHFLRRGRRSRSAS